MQQIDFILQKRNLTPLNCELSVKIHGWLMAQVSADISKSMHTSEEFRPFSLFTRVQRSNIALRFSLLHESARPLLEKLRSARLIEVSGLDGSIAVIDRAEKTAATLDLLRRSAPKKFEIILASPTSYKHNKRPCNLYALSPLLATAAEKLRTFEGVDVSNEEIAALSDLVTYPHYELRSAMYRLKTDVVMPGFEGKLTICPGGSGEQRDKLSLLLRYAQYAGVGAKTALGMGGILLME